MTSEQTYTPINLAPLLAGLEQPLLLVSDPDLRDRLQVYIDAARPQVERAAFDLLSQVVSAVNDAGGDQRASLEYTDGGLRLRVDEAPEGEPEASFSTEGDLEKVTLRLPQELKELIDQAAARHGMSANNWYVRALSRAMARHFRDAMPGEGREGHRGGRRRGFYRGRHGGFRDEVAD